MKGLQAAEMFETRRETISINDTAMYLASTIPLVAYKCARLYVLIILACIFRQLVFVPEVHTSTDKAAPPKERVCEWELRVATIQHLLSDTTRSATRKMQSLLPPHLRDD